MEEPDAREVQVELEPGNRPGTAACRRRARSGVASGARGARAAAARLRIPGPRLGLRSVRHGQGPLELLGFAGPDARPRRSVARTPARQAPIGACLRPERGGLPVPLGRAPDSGARGRHARRRGSASGRIRRHLRQRRDERRVRLRAPGHDPHPGRQPGLRRTEELVGASPLRSLPSDQRPARRALPHPDRIPAGPARGALPVRRTGPPRAGCARGPRRRTQREEACFYAEDPESRARRMCVWRLDSEDEAMACERALTREHLARAA